MDEATNKPSASNWLTWFDARRRDVGYWAFALNRITALGLTFYLFLHLGVLSQLSQGPQAYDHFIAMMKQPLFTAGEVLVVSAGFIHGLNGIRIALNSLGVANEFQKALFIALMIVAILVSFIFAVRMFTA